MNTKKVYKYRRKSGGITISTHKPVCEHEELLRLIADDGRLLTNGEITEPCIEVESADGWREIDAPKNVIP